MGEHTNVCADAYSDDSVASVLCVQIIDFKAIKYKLSMYFIFMWSPMAANEFFN